MFKKGSKRFCSLLRESIKDETGARKEYRVLKSHAPTVSMKTAIDRIIVGHTRLCFPILRQFIPAIIPPATKPAKKDTVNRVPHPHGDFSVATTELILHLPIQI